MNFFKIIFKIQTRLSENELKLSRKDAMLLMDVLDEPRRPNAWLQQAVARYRDKLQ